MDYFILFPIYLLVLMSAAIFRLGLSGISRDMDAYLEEAADFPEAWLPGDPENSYWWALHGRGVTHKRELDSEMRYQSKLYVFTGRPLKYLKPVLLAAAVLLFCVFLALAIAAPDRVERNMTILFSAGIAAAFFLLLSAFQAEYHETARMIKDYLRKREDRRSLGSD